MNRKDYDLIAATIARTLADESDQDRLNYQAGVRTTYAGGVRLTANALAHTFKDENPKFDRVDFLKKCGVTS